MKKQNPHLIERQKKENIRLRNKVAFFPSQPVYTYYPFHLPVAFDFHNKRMRNATLKAINSLKEMPQGKRPYFDFSEVDTLSSMATIHFTQMLEKYSTVVCRGKHSKSPIVSGMLSKLKVYNRLNIKETNSKHDLVDRWYTFSGENADFGDEYDAIENVLKEKFGEDSITFDVINTAICEAVINVVNHAYDESDKYRKWNLFLAIKPDRCAVVISDLGKTIPQSIPTKINDLMLKDIFNFESWFGLNDQEKIEIATNYQRTSTNLSYRGKGFQDMKQVCEEVEGSTMMVHSRKGYWAKGYSKFEKNLDKKANYKSQVNGTIISWLIPLNDSTIQLANA
ncbi:ATP-binding protein [Acinetobacter schindleri]|uniref:ATP-binding protein n=1 Tax=Acinetobacter schindleri TaxID=108981 RepID=UPI0013B09593|nr:ATP-binding protein [Acinetobacter schindleri]QIC63488.1 ATP-binding protein [Acinetobacter schindleri]